jgi:excisionase family DNA binding protein
MAVRANDGLMESCSPRQLELFAEALADSERAQSGLAGAHDRRSRLNPDAEALLAVPAKPRTRPTETRSAARRPALTEPSTAGPRALPRLAVSPDEAAAMLGVSRDYLDEHVIGELRVVRRGRRILIALAELERWLDRNGTRASVGRA